QKEMVQDRLNRLPAILGAGQRFGHFGELNLGHDAQDVVLGLEIIEERSLAHVRGLGNVFDRNVLEAAFGEQMKGAAEKPDAGLGGAALAAASGARMGRSRA